MGHSHQNHPKKLVRKSMSNPDKIYTVVIALVRNGGWCYRVGRLNQLAHANWLISSVSDVTFLTVTSETRFGRDIFS